MAAPEGRAASCQDDNPAFSHAPIYESEVNNMSVTIAGLDAPAAGEIQIIKIETDSNNTTKATLLNTGLSEPKDLGPVT